MKPAQQPVSHWSWATSQPTPQSVHWAASPASQLGAGLKPQPLAGLQASTVQLMESLQTSGSPGEQVPPMQRSPSVHALASTQAVPSGFGALVHCPFTGLQVEVMQAPDAGQTTGLAPRQTPDWQPSTWVQAFWSSQAEPFGLAGWLQRPVAGSHVPATRHASVAVQTIGALPTQMPT